jgi:hypothetical protein
LGALELIDEAVHLLRRAPWSALGTYYLGSLPFGLGFLYFWADMSRGSGAREHLASGALQMALLFLWMKTWQAVFAGRLKAHITGRPVAAWTLASFARVLLVQTILQPSGLFLLTLSLLILLPFGWVNAFYQNVTVFAAEDGARLREVFRRALRQAGLWPGQNHVLLGILSLFGFVIFVDVAVGLGQVPALLKMIFGVESAFTRAPMSFLNTTFLAAVCCVCYLCLDPLVKAIYALRCFYGEALRTGEDLRAELKSAAGGANAMAAMAVLLLFVFVAALPAEPVGGTRASSFPGGQISRFALFAAVAPVEPATGAGVRDAGIPPPALDRSLDRVLEQREYNWRLSREKAGADESKGFFASFMDGLVDTLRRWSKEAVRWVIEFVEWLREKVFGKRKTTDDSGGSGLVWVTSLQLLIVVLLAAAAAVAGVLFYRAWRRRGGGAEVASEAVVPMPDLADEGVVANQLPEDEWLRLARELMGRGEWRLALRALYLAGLAHLAQRDMISVAKFKSNRDYERELGRRARALPELQAAFAENVWHFDRAWYGLHEVNRQTLERFQVNLEKIKAC